MYVSITKLIIAFFSIFRDLCETERQDKQLSLRGQQRPRMRLNFVQTMCTSSYLSFIFLGLFRHLSGINDTAITHRCTFAKSLNLHINIAADDGIVLQGPDHLPSLSKTFLKDMRQCLWAKWLYILIKFLAIQLKLQHFQKYKII